MLRLFTLAALLLLSCTKEAPTAFTGTWTLYEVYGNDYWGGPAYWKKADNKTKIRFTDSLYYKKYYNESDYTLIGSYKILPGNIIAIKPVNTSNTSNRTYNLNYEFSSGGYMTWGPWGTEATIQEKYRLDN